MSKTETENKDLRRLLSSFARVSKGLASDYRASLMEYEEEYSTGEDACFQKVEDILAQNANMNWLENLCEELEESRLLEIRCPQCRKSKFAKKTVYQEILSDRGGEKVLCETYFSCVGCGKRFSKKEASDMGLVSEVPA